MHVSKSCIHMAILLCLLPCSRQACHLTGMQCIAISLCIFFLAAFIFAEAPFRKYTPENNADVFALLQQQKHRHQTEAVAAVAGAQRKRMLFTTMLSSDFSNYGAGAQRLAQAMHKDIPSLSAELGLEVRHPSPCCFQIHPDKTSCQVFCTNLAGGPCSARGGRASYPSKDLEGIERGRLAIQDHQATHRSPN